jgi:hypothetical protein
MATSADELGSTVLVHARPMYPDGKCGLVGSELVCKVNEAEALGRWVLGTTLWIGTKDERGVRCDSVEMTITTELDRYTTELVARFQQEEEDRNDQ